MSARQTLRSSAIAAPRFHYSPCVRIGDTWQVSGMVALDPVTGALTQGGPGDETARILANLQLALPDYGITLDDLLIARVFTTRMERFSDINGAWESFFIQADAPPPARTSVGVSALPLGASVEIEFTFINTRGSRAGHG